MYKVGSLFSGIGGIDYGFEATGKFQVIWQSEIEEYACKVLKKNWPKVPNLGDITKIDWSEVEVPDVLVGGFPCQDISIAGRGVGIDGERSGLWKEFAEAIRVLRPKLVVVENVPMLLRRGVDVVLGDLALCGYDAEWTIISAQSVGAWHKRDRLFIVAYPSQPKGPSEFDRGGGEQGARESGGGVGQIVLANSNSQRLQRHRRSEVFDEIRGKETIGVLCRRNRGSIWRADPADLEDTRRELREQRSEVEGIDGPLHQDGTSRGDIERPSEALRDSDNGDIWEEGGLSDGASDTTGSSEVGGRGVESPMGRLVDGVSPWMDCYTPRITKDNRNRSNRLKCLGNAVVPQVAEAVANMIIRSEILERTDH